MDDPNKQDPPAKRRRKAPMADFSGVESGSSSVADFSDVESAASPGEAPVPQPRGAQHPLGALRNAIGRTVGTAANDLIEGTTDLGASILDGLQIDKVDDDFKRFVEDKQFRQQAMDAVTIDVKGRFGKNPGGVQGFAETASGFVLKMAAGGAASKLAKGVISLPALPAAASATLARFGASTFGQYAKTVGRFDTFAKLGAFADFMSDPETSNLINLLPESRRQGLLSALASDDEDPAVLNRVRGAFSGLLVGRVLDGVVSSFKVGRALLKGEATGVAKEAVEPAAPVKAAAKAVDVQQTADGFVVTLNGQPLGRLFGTADEALQTAAVVERRAVAVDAAGIAARVAEVPPEALKGSVETVAESMDLPVAALLDDAEAGKVADAVRGRFAESLTEGRRLDAEAVQTAKATGSLLSDEAIIAQTRKSASAFNDGDIDNLIAQARVKGLTRELSQVSELIETNGGTVAEQVMYARDLLTKVTQLMEAQGNLASGAGRTLRSQRVARGDFKAVLEPTLAADGAAAAATRVAPESAGFFAGMTDAEIMSTIKLVRLAGDDPTVLKRLVESGALEPVTKATDPRAGEIFERLRMNALLGSPRTQVVNLTGNLFNSLYTPMQMLTSGDAEVARTALDLFAGMWHSASDALKGFKAAWPKGQPILDRDLKWEINQDVVSFDGWFNKLAYWPQRFMVSVDEGAKVMNYRSAVYSKALSEGRRLGKNGQALAEYVTDAVESSIGKDGRFLDESAMEWARGSTFQRPFTKDGWFEAFDGFVNKKSDTLKGLRPMKLIAPFVRTPAGILLSAIEQAPVVQMLSPRLRADLTAGGLREAGAKAKVAMSRDLAVLTTGAAMAGVITGKGPQDPDVRKQMLAAGWRPYSIKVGDTYVSYRVIEPLATYLRVISTMTEAAMDGGEDGDKLEDLFIGALAAGAEATYDVSFLTGVSDMMNALNGSLPDWIKDNARERLVTGIAPVPDMFVAGASKTAADVTDPYLRETNGFLERYQSRMPYFNRQLDPKRDVFGNPVAKTLPSVLRAVSPVDVSTAGNTPQEATMLALVEAMGGDESAPEPFQKVLRVGGTSFHTDRRTGEGKESPYSYRLSLLDSGTLSDGKGDTLPKLSEAVQKMMDGDGKWLEFHFGSSKARELLLWQYAGESTEPAAFRLGVYRDLLQPYQESSKLAMLEKYPRLGAAVARAEDSGKLPTLREEKRNARRQQRKTQEFMESGAPSVRGAGSQ